MMKDKKTILYISVPLLCALLVGMFFGYSKYFEELKSGSDDVDALRWAFLTGLFLSAIGLGIGLVIDLFVWVSATSNGKVDG